jgi:hypothetical protein
VAVVGQSSCAVSRICKFWLVVLMRTLSTRHDCMCLIDVSRLHNIRWHGMLNACICQELEPFGWVELLLADCLHRCAVTCCVLIVPLVLRLLCCAVL